ncbi:MAG: cardiolipin synthase [Thermoanaerobaculia bacterium]|jgi:cardiolipin synthase|nr:cardiolipin synthase [Thermoanaerobaculia bacterium]
MKKTKWIELDKRGSHIVRVPLIVFAALVIAVAGLTVMLWSAERGTDPKLNVKNVGDFSALLPSIVGLTQSTLESGNQIQLLENGDQFFPLLLRDIAAAKQSVHVESYIWWKGAICAQIANALASKARQGVEVRLLVDASGGHKMDKDLEKLMIDSGVRFIRFHPFSLSNLGRMNNRDHRKEAIIDGRIGYIGGYGFAEEWTGHGQDKDHWRDAGLRVEGPVVSRLQSAFAENWIEETGEIMAGEKYFPHLDAVGSTKAHLAYTSPTGGVSSVQVLYYLAIKAARHEIIIQNPYMLPDAESMEALAEAVKRGVDVRVMVPATTSTDSPVVQHASHHLFGELLKAGVKIFEYKKTLLHQKVMIVDGVWSCVGSTNFDRRALELNDEVSMGVLDASLAAQLKAVFEADMQFAEERHFEEWKHRGLWHKAEDGLAYVASSQL